MPSTDELLAGLARIANDYTYVAMTWHLVFLIFIILLLTGKRPPSRYVSLFLTLPLISVGLLALLSGNPFNAIVFLLLSVILILYGLKFPAGNIEIKLNIWGIIGILMIVFAWVYPHFLESGSMVQYLYAAPMGLIPCPTLSLVIGFTLLFQGFHSVKWILVLSLIGLYYGLTGLLKFHVYLDAGLIIGTLVLGMLYFSTRRQTA